MSDFATPRTPAASSAPEDMAGTLPYFMKLFRNTVEYRRLSDATRKRTYEYGFRIISKWSAQLGHIPVDQITHAHCVKLCASLTPPNEDGVRMLARAWAVVKSLSRILSYARKKGAIERSPAFDLKMPESAPREVAWSQADIRAFTDRAIALDRWSLALAVRMAADHGHWRADIIKARRRDYDGEYLRVVQQKTGARIKVLCTPELKAMLDALPPGDGPVGDTSQVRAIRYGAIGTRDGVRRFRAWSARLIATAHSSLRAAAAAPVALLEDSATRPNSLAGS